MKTNFFNFDNLAILSASLIIFISVIIFFYAKNYLTGEKTRLKFLTIIPILAISLITAFSADNIFIMAIAWLMSNLLLIALIIYKTSWRESVNSGRLVLKNFIFGFSCLSLGLLIISYMTKSFTISNITANSDISSSQLMLPCALILIAIFSQSALYPFHKWLLSSLNSPTPASALMHAGLINGGGIIFARLSPLFFKVPELLTIAFIVGIFSAVIGTFWKLIQANVKSMLACSTMSQMGFMIAQCAMGLFPAGIAHLFWHGMFKSYLFLSSPSSWQEKRLDLNYPPKIPCFIASLLCGAFGAYLFAKINLIDFANHDTTIVLVAVCFIASSQVALTIINKSLLKNFIPALILSSFVSALYASSVVFIENLIMADFFKPQPLNLWHYIGTIALVAMWLTRLFGKKILTKNHSYLQKFYHKIFVLGLNASQPQSNTITTNRNNYNFK